MQGGPNTVVPFRRPDPLRLWDAYAELHAELLRDMALGLDRDFMERHARAWAAWRDAYLDEGL